MPIYEYQCPECGLTRESVQVVRAACEAMRCPVCDVLLIRLVSAPSIVYEMKARHIDE
jgi:putative FmdB family regulatory protein